MQALSGGVFGAVGSWLEGLVEGTQRLGGGLATVGSAVSVAHAVSMIAAGGPAFEPGSLPDASPGRGHSNPRSSPRSSPQLTPRSPSAPPALRAARPAGAELAARDA